MTALTVWRNAAGEVRLHQLTDDHDAIVGYKDVATDEVETDENGMERSKTVPVPIYGPVPYKEQIAHLATLAFMEGFTCVEENYTGTAPEVDASLWQWNGSAITAVVPVPASVTPRQVRLLLLQQGLLANVEAMIKAADQATQITWEFATEFKRDNPLLEQLSKALGLTDAQVDQFFIAAASI